MFTVTTQAAVQIAKAAEMSGATGMPLRLAAKLDDDGRLSLGMGFDEARLEDMEIVAPAGVNVLIGPKSWPLLKDATLDYVELQPGEFAFILIPPPTGDGTATEG